MYYRIIPILVTLAVIIIGFIVRAINARDISKRREFTLLFQNTFVELANNFFKTGRMPDDLYLKCIHDVDAIQAELGNDGIIAGYVDRLHGIKGKNYQLFVNIIPEIREAESMIDNSIMMERVSQLIGTCNDALQRHVGNLDRELNKERKGIFNPFICFREGIRFIIGLPPLILYWSGVISTRTISAARASSVFKFISGVITLIGLISSIITILLGWNEAVEIVVKIWKLF